MLAQRAKLLTSHQLVLALEHVAGGRYPDRDRLMLLLSAKAGLRAGEIAKLTWPMLLDARGRVGSVIELVEAAWQAVRGPGPLHAFYQRVARRRGNHIAAVAVARKLAVIVWHLLRRGEDYASTSKNPLVMRRSAVVEAVGATPMC